MIAFLRVRGKKGLLIYCHKLVQEAGIMLLPSTVYDFDDCNVRLGDAC